jgi:hypothetical protein
VNWLAVSMILTAVGGASVLITLAVLRWAERHPSNDLDPLPEWPPPLSSYIKEYRRVP